MVEKGVVERGVVEAVGHPSLRQLLLGVRVGGQGVEEVEERRKLGRKTPWTTKVSQKRKVATATTSTMTAAIEFAVAVVVMQLLPHRQRHQVAVADWPTAKKRPTMPDRAVNLFRLPQDLP